MNIIDYLKAVNYDYLPLCNADGVQDDTVIMQMRIDAGFSPFRAKTPNKGIYTFKRINLPSNFILDGSDV